MRGSRPPRLRSHRAGRPSSPGLGAGSSRATSSRRFPMRSTISIDLAALRRNAARLVEALAGSELWAVVKADAYGHGALDCARAALGAGAKSLCVATVAE